MSAKASTASNVIKLDAARRRGARVVDAAHVVAIDYRSIVTNAIASLAQNTPQARREVYAQARRVVRRHLTLMRLPAPIVGLEQLSLDLAIRRIEREWRNQQTIDAIAFDLASVSGSRAAGPSSAAESRRADRAQRRFLRAPSLALPKVAALSAPLRFLRRALVSSVGVTVAVPVGLIAIILVFLVDNRAAYQTLADSTAARWLSQADWSIVMPWRHRAKSTYEIAGGDAGQTALAPIPPTPAAPPVAASPPYRGATPIRPIRADLSSLTAARAPEPKPERPTMLAAATPAVQVPSEMPAERDMTTAPETPTVPDLQGFATQAAAPQAEEAQTAVAQVASAQVAMTHAEGAQAPGPCDDASEPGDHISCAMGEYARSGLGAKSHARWFAGYAAINDAAGPHSVVQAVASTSWPPAGAAAVTDARPAAPTAVARSTNAKVAALVSSGRKWSERGDLDRAMHDFTEAIRLDPKYPDSYHERGLVLFKMGETDRAIADYSAAIKGDPQFGAALRSRGMAYLYRGTQDRALADLARAIDLAESDPSTLPPIELFYAHRSRAQIYSAMQQHEPEIADCTAALDSYDRNPALVEELRQNYTDIGAANVIATVYRQRAAAYNRQGKWQAAIDDLTAAVPLSYDHGFVALMDRSKLHEGIGQREAAVADIQAALAVRPGSEEARVALRRLGALPRPAMPVGAL